jgi:hypothetical protein
MNKVCFVIIAVTLFISCNTSEKPNPENLPPATGKPGNMVLILDSIQWHGALGSTLRTIFREEVQGIPREETMFDVTWVYPRKGSTLLTQIRNLVFVFTLDQKSAGSQIMKSGFSPETLQRIQTDTSFYFYTSKDEYSRGQEILYLFGDTEENLIRHLEKNKKSIQAYFNNAERQRIQKKLVSTSSTKGVTEFLRREQDCELKVPFGYKLADKQNDFVWLRQMDPEVDKDIFISWKKYTSEKQLQKDSIIRWRDVIASRYLFEDPEQPDSYLVTETSVPFRQVLAKQMKLNNHYAVELRGLWKTNTNTMGGPFISYTLIDEKKGLLYYIEGFTYSPSKSQREIIRELEAILWTFKGSL